MPKCTLPKGKIKKTTKLPHIYMEILKCAALGYNVEETAKRVGLAYKTVENYRYNMCHAFNCRNIVDLVVQMIRNGVIE